mgnify:CR=1 FL=1
MIGRTEVELRPGPVFDLAELMKFSTVVGGDRTNVVHVTLDERDDFSIKFGSVPGAKLSDDGVAGFPFNERDDAMAVIGSDHGINFPVPEP